MMLTPHGVWCSTDHRLTAYPTGKLITDTSTKHVLLRCTDGAALVAYTGLGRVGKLDVSAWLRGVLRGESRTVDESLIDLREQATARIGRQAQIKRVPHAFVAGAFLGDRLWAIEIRNVRSVQDLEAGRIQPRFETAAFEVTEAGVVRAGGGAQAVGRDDLVQLEELASRRPRRATDFMKLLGDVNRRAAESGRRGAKTVSKSCTVVFMPPSGEGVEVEWYGPENERPQAPSAISHVHLGIDLAEVMAGMQEQMRLHAEGDLSEEELHKRWIDAGNRAIKPEDRRDP
jgi:hypothetical protein